MSDDISSFETVETVEEVEPSADPLDGQLIGQLVDRARASGLRLTGEGGASVTPVGWTEPIGRR